MEYFTTIVNAETGEEETRPMTEQEVADLTIEENVVDNEAVKQSALEKLQALGLTEEEAKAIAGI